MKSNAGYTLIELLVGLTIIGVLFTIGYISFRDFSRRQALAGLVKTVQGDVRLTQQMALSGQKPDDPKCNAPNTLTGYNFQTVSPSEYQIIAGCSGGNGIPSVPAKDVTLPDGITLSSSLNPIFFKVLGQGTNIANGGDAVLTFTQSATNNTAT